jgi:hypothetical protein
MVCQFYTELTCEKRLALRGLRSAVNQFTTKGVCSGIVYSVRSKPLLSETVLPL